MDAVIFDMDGILIDSERIYLERTLRFLKQEGIPFQMADVLALAGGSSAHAERFVRKVAGSDVDMADFFRRMDACCPMRYPLALASSSRMERIQEVLSACRLDGLFRFCLSGEMFTESKPSPQIYLTAANMLALPPQACVAIEDSTYGILAAKRAGMRVIARKDERFGFDQSQADACFSDYRELPDILCALQNR